MSRESYELKGSCTLISMKRPLRIAARFDDTMGLMRPGYRARREADFGGRLVHDPIR